MNLLIKTAELECRGPVTRSDVRQPPIRAYRDAITITTTSTIGARWVLKGIEKLVTWARMSFNASKSRSLVLKKGIAMEKGHFKLSGETIPTIQENSTKSLGKRIDCSVMDTIAMRETKDNLEKWLTRVDKSVYQAVLKHEFTNTQSSPKYCGFYLWIYNGHHWANGKENQLSLAEMVGATEMP